MALSYFHGRDLEVFRDSFSGELVGQIHSANGKHEWWAES